MDLAVEITGVLPAPLPLAFQLAGRLTLRLQAEALMPGITPAWSEPNPTVTTLSQPLRAHRLLPKTNKEEYDKHNPLPEPFTPIVAVAPEQKKEEDDP